MFDSEPVVSVLIELQQVLCLRPLLLKVAALLESHLELRVFTVSKVLNKVKIPLRVEVPEGAQMHEQL